MKVLLFGREGEKLKEFFGEGFTIVEEEPEVVVAYGGDGALLKAEFEYPEVPKILLKNSRVANKAHSLEHDKVAQKLAAGEYRTEELFKLSAKANGKELTALNDIVVHNENPRHAIRYHVFIDGTQYSKEIVGDGVIAATPFGASGYYRSITDSIFEVGIGIAFNNSHEPSDHLVLRDDRTVEIEIVRGPVMCYADNQEECIPLSEGERVVISKSSSVARIIKLT
jgi:NAD+ kinase